MPESEEMIRCRVKRKRRGRLKFEQWFAPRPVFISSGSPAEEGTWVDAKGMFLGEAHAGPIYKFLGKKGLGTTEFPLLGTNLSDGDVAFRQHKGGHTTGPNWPYFIEFAAGYLD